MSKKQQSRIDPTNDPDEEEETVRRKKRRFRNDPRMRHCPDPRQHKTDDRAKKPL